MSTQTNGNSSILLVKAHNCEAPRSDHCPVHHLDFQFFEGDESRLDRLSDSLTLVALRQHDSTNMSHVGAWSWTALNPLGYKGVEINITVFYMMFYNNTSTLFVLYVTGSVCNHTNTANNPI